MLANWAHFALSFAVSTNSQYCCAACLLIATNKSHDSIDLLEKLCLYCKLHPALYYSICLFCLCTICLELCSCTHLFCRLAINLQMPTKIRSLPVCFHRLVVLCYRHLFHNFGTINLLMMMMVMIWQLIYLYILYIYVYALYTCCEQVKQ